MTREFTLPVVEVAVTVYPSQFSYESGVVALVLRERERFQRQLGPKAKLLSEAEFASAGRNLSVSSDAVGNYRDVAINDFRAGKYLWTDWIRLLAHELTHSAEKELIGGRPASPDRWIQEGFAEWVGYQVADRFGAETFAKSRENMLERIAEARVYQTFPGLTQLAGTGEWVTWFRTLGYAGTYAHALIAVDMLIKEKGVAALVQYFRLFGKANNRERNFAAVFAETQAGFEERFRRHLEGLKGAERTGAVR